MRKFASIVLLATVSVSGLCYPSVFHQGDRICIDDDSFKVNEEGDEFYIHTGNNVWLVTNSIHRDSQGLFALDSQVRKSMGMEYEKKWKCPYCFSYWPIGKPCGNPDCPSKYK